MSQLENHSQATQPLEYKRSWARFLVRAVIIYALVPYLSLILLVAIFQRQLIYHPSKTERLLAANIGGAEVPIDDVQIPAENGLFLHGWRYRSRVVPEEKCPAELVIYFPGNAGCRRDRVADCVELTTHGCDVLLVDYRGYGDNAGSPSEDALAADARRVWTFVTNDLHIPHDRVVLFGESLGGAMAVRLAAERSAAGEAPAALVLNSTFASLGETAAWHFPILPVRWLLRDRFESVARISQVTCPLLQFHGTADSTVPYEHGRRLFETHAATKKATHADHFLAIPDGEHNFITVSHMESAIRTLFSELCTNDQTQLNRKPVPNGSTEAADAISR